MRDLPDGMQRPEPHSCPMSDPKKGALITVTLIALGPVGWILLDLAARDTLGVPTAALLGLVFGILYACEAATLLIYDLGSWRGWIELVVDLTWSLPNTVFGFVFGNLIYIFFGTPSRDDSRDAGWIVFRPRSKTSAFGNDVLQTLGVVNLGGPGNHEPVHLLQSRILGPAYLPFVAVSYLVTGAVQVVWSLTVGLALWGLGARQTAYFRPPKRSAVGGFWGWIYFATPLELWAYATEK